MDLSVSGRYLAAPDKQQKHALIWDIGQDDTVAKDPRRFAVQENESDRIQAIHFAADDDHFFTLGTAGVAKRWRFSDGELIDTYGEPVQTAVPVMDVSRSGDRLAVASGNELMVWDVPSGKLIGKASGPVFGMKHIVFSNSGDYVAVCGLSEAGRSHGLEDRIEPASIDQFWKSASRSDCANGQPRRGQRRLRYRRR